MSKYKGTVKKNDLEGGFWQLVTDDGATYQLQGADSSLLVEGQKVEVEGKDGRKTITGKHIILATGSRPKSLPMLKIDGDRVWSSDQAVFPEAVPASLGIVGAAKMRQYPDPDRKRFAFGVSAAAAPLLMALLFYRAVLGAPLPAPLRPSWFILLVPPSLIYANGIALFAQTFFLESLYFAALILGAALLVNARTLWQWPFGAPWWAFTFPLDAVAYAAARYAQDHPAPLWQALSAATLALATLFVATVLLRFLAAILRSGASRPA